MGEARSVGRTHSVRDIANEIGDPARAHVHARESAVRVCDVCVRVSERE